MTKYIEATAKELADTLLRHGRVSFAARYETDDSGMIFECEDWFGATIVNQFNGQYILVTSCGGGMCFAYNVTQVNDIVPAEVAESTFAYLFSHELKIPNGTVCVEPAPPPEPEGDAFEANRIVTTVVVERGNYYMGGKSHKGNGIIEETSPRWEADPEGSAVVVSAYDRDKNKQIGEASLFTFWDSVGVDNCVREKLALTRRNFPTPEELYRWIKEWDGRRIDLCENICEGVCAGYDCSVCPVSQIKAEL